jgi:dTDP-glucose 4,6-dehydratase
MKLLVTGGLGFIGLNFVLANHEKHDIDVLDKQTYAANSVELLPIEAGFINEDICEINEFFVDTDYDWIIHFAAESHVDNALNDATPFWETNVKGTYELTKFALKHDIKFFHVSTDEVFGEWVEGEPEFTEESPYRPNNMYSVSKAASDQIVRAQHRSYGLQYIITNCGNNYGPYQHPEKFIPKVKSGKVTLHAGGTPVRDWIDVRDHVSAIEAAMNGPINETYVISARDAMTTLKVCKLAGIEYDFNGERPGVDMGYKLNPAKLEALGWKPKHKLKEWLR